MYKQDPRFETPDDTFQIWRYMNYDKFKSLITQKILYFCSVNTLKKEDPYEGSYYACDFLNQIGTANARNFANQIDQCGPPIAVNCWHLNEGESMAMWKIYARDKGIAIRTTIQKLKNVFDQFHDSIWIGKISYTDDPIDHPTGWTADKFMACMTKRKCYDYEKEVRAFIWNTKEIARTTDGSAKIPVKKVDDLIEDIYLAPDIENKLEDTVRDLIGESIPVTKSPILTPPSF